MDLGAFLHAGRSYPVLFADASALPCPPPPVRGELLARRGRPFWRAEGSLGQGSVMLITLEMRGFVALEDSSLCPGGPESSASLVLAGRVERCRYFRLLNGYALHIDLLGRVLPDSE